MIPTRFLFCLLSLCFIARVLLAFFLPLSDTTEARYGEMARKMVTDHDWLVPQFQTHTSEIVPFWGKPPLAFWLSALGIKLFGVTEWGARVFILLSSFLLTGFFYLWLKSLWNATQALLAVVILWTLPLFFVASAAVMTDSVLCVGITLAMMGFWQAFQRSKKWGLLGFLGLGLGLLAKGPLVLVLVGGAILLWALGTKSLGVVFKRLPWFWGIGLMCVVSLPWYVAAELSSPGFLNYFIWGEHIQRFLVGGWAGDLYGDAHHRTYGMIWLFALGAAFPGSLLLFKSKKFDIFDFYLLCFTLVPLLFFTFSGNILWTYALPSLPPFAILLAKQWTYWNPLTQKIFLRSLFLLPGCALLLVIVAVFRPEFLVSVTQKPVVEWVQHKTLTVAVGSKSSVPCLVYWGTQRDSTIFYTQNQARFFFNVERLERFVSELPTHVTRLDPCQDPNRSLFLIVQEKRKNDIPITLLQKHQFEQVQKLDGWLIYAKTTLMQNGLGNDTGRDFRIY